MDTLRAILVAAALLLTSCGHDPGTTATYGASTADIGAAQQVLGWNISVANLRFAADHVLVDIDAAVADADPEADHAKPEDLRFGLYGGLIHPIEATGLGSCQRVVGSDIRPLATAAPDRLSGTVCLGPIRDQSQVRGVYAYSPRERIPGTVVAYPAAYPVGLPPTNAADSGLELSATSVEAWRADGTALTPAALGDADAFTGGGYMLLGLRIQALGARYRDDSAARGGPMMVLVAPTLPPPGLSPACSVYGSSVLVLPDASYDSVQLEASLCTQGEINEALLYATVSVVGTRAAVWLADEHGADRAGAR